MKHIESQESNTKLCVHLSPAKEKAQRIFVGFIHTFEDSLRKSQTSCCSAILAIDKRSYWTEQIIVTKFEVKSWMNARDKSILEDICPVECIVGAQGNHQY